MIAAIDIGSNSVRMLCQYPSHSEKQTKITRLAEGVADSGILKIAAINRTTRVVKMYVNEALRKNAEHIYIFATEAVRRAANLSDFVFAVKDSVGLDMDVIDGASEALIGFLGVANLGDYAGIIDVGGASSEVAISRGEDGVLSKSIPLGAVVLTDMFGQNLDKMDEYLSDVVSYDFTAFGKDNSREVLVCPMYTVGGTGATLAAMDLGLVRFSAKKVHGHKLSRLRVRELAELIFSVPVNKRNFAGLSKSRRDIMGAGALMLYTIMVKLGLDHVIYSDSDNLEGYIKYKTYVENKLGI